MLGLGGDEEGEEGEDDDAGDHCLVTLQRGSERRSKKLFRDTLYTHDCARKFHENKFLNAAGVFGTVQKKRIWGARNRKRYRFSVGGRKLGLSRWWSPQNVARERRVPLKMSEQRRRARNEKQRFDRFSRINQRER